MIIKFEVKIDENLGTIYEFPILNVRGSFGENDLDEFITQLSNDIKEKVTDYIENKNNKKEVKE